MLNKTIQELEFAAIDFESAGTAPGKTDTPIQIGICVWSIKLGIFEKWTSYIHTHEEVTWAAQKVHRITNQKLLDAPKLMLLWPNIKSLLENRAIVAHGHGTEKRFLRAFPGHKFAPWIDTLTLARKAWPDMESYGLGDLCHSLNISEKIQTQAPDKTWHDALFDSIASIMLLNRLIEEHTLESYPLSAIAN